MKKLRALAIAWLACALASAPSAFAMGKRLHQPVLVTELACSAKGTLYDVWNFIPLETDLDARIEVLDAGARLRAELPTQSFGKFSQDYTVARNEFFRPKKLYGTLAGSIDPQARQGADLFFEFLVLNEQRALEGNVEFFVGSSDYLFHGRAQCSGYKTVKRRSSPRRRGENKSFSQLPGPFPEKWTRFSSRTESSP